MARFQGENWSIEFGVALLVVCQNTQVASPFPPGETCWHRGKSMEIPTVQRKLRELYFFPHDAGSIWEQMTNTIDFQCQVRWPPWTDRNWLADWCESPSLLRYPGAAVVAFEKWRMARMALESKLRWAQVSSKWISVFCTSQGHKTAGIRTDSERCPAVGWRPFKAGHAWH